MAETEKGLLTVGYRTRDIVILGLLLLTVLVLVFFSCQKRDLDRQYVWKSDKPVSAALYGHKGELSADRIRSLLSKVMDPELNVSITDLGLIRDISVKGNSAHIVMTLTVPTCPLAKDIIESVRAALFSYPGVREARLDLTFDPPWSWEDTRPGLREELIMRMRAEKGLAEGGSR